MNGGECRVHVKHVNDEIADLVTAQTPTVHGDETTKPQTSAQL